MLDLCRCLRPATVGNRITGIRRPLSKSERSRHASLNYETSSNGLDEGCEKRHA